MAKNSELTAYIFVSFGQLSYFNFAGSWRAELFYIVSHIDKWNNNE